jgi:hypothetical protein
LRRWVLRRARARAPVAARSRQISRVRCHPRPCQISTVIRLTNMNQSLVSQLTACIERNRTLNSPNHPRYVQLPPRLPSRPKAIPPSSPDHSPQTPQLVDTTGTQRTGVIATPDVPLPPPRPRLDGLSRARVAVARGLAGGRSGVERGRGSVEGRVRLMRGRLDKAMYGCFG